MFAKYKGILKMIPKNVSVKKEDFCNLINSMKEVDKRFEDICKIFEDNDTMRGPITINDKLYTNILTILKKEFGDEKTNVIEWWMYENVDKNVYISKDSSINLTNEEVIVSLDTVEDLYDYLVYLN